ncbi:unnamed protein product, partial [Angiostrongylus costaricensis]|uniref:FRIGIDA-like protein n=1 Tax=Angiostrongylus costaricensis TaxID=334426 RepID=A0A0R3PFH9_ANGCS
LESNSVAVFAVNYIQNHSNRFIAAEFCTEIARIFAILNVKTVAEFEKAIEALRNEPTTGTAEIEYFEAIMKSWEEFIDGIEKTLVEKVGPSMTNTDKDMLPELGIENKTISLYVKGSAFDMVLLFISFSVFRSFTSASVMNHIMELCNKIPEFRKLGCDVCLLTRGPPMGVRGGSYIKLIGEPFRKLYDDNEALAELKCHRRPAMDRVGWNALLQVKRVRSSFFNFMRWKFSAGGCGGTILVGCSGKLLYKYIEDENASWPHVDDILDQVKKLNSSNPPKTYHKTKVGSEISAKEKDSDKACCIIL